MVAALGQDLEERAVYFGLDDPTVGARLLPHAADAKFCPRCGTALEFSRVYLGHVGHYRCPRGDFARPTPALRGRRLQIEGMERLFLELEGVRAPATVPLTGIYNAYNVLAAVAAAQAFGIPPAQASAALADFQPAFGRQERLTIDGHPVYLLLAKNPTGFNEVLRTAIDFGKGTDFLIAINDHIADGQDVSWLWDVDFEQLRGAAQRITVAGDRAQDMALRLKYAEVPVGVVSVAAGPWRAAWDQALTRTPPGVPLFVLPTYTAMLELRAVLTQRGIVSPYWR
jgi:UDP-N-acetylmuramyl tripeptide synthase